MVALLKFEYSSWSNSITFNLNSGKSTNKAAIIHAVQHPNQYFQTLIRSHDAVVMANGNGSWWMGRWVIFITYTCVNHFPRQPSITTSAFSQSTWCVNFAPPLYVCVFFLHWMKTNPYSWMLNCRTWIQWVHSPTWISVRLLWHFKWVWSSWVLPGCTWDLNICFWWISASSMVTFLHILRCLFKCDFLVFVDVD